MSMAAGMAVQTGHVARNEGCKQQEVLDLHLGERM